MQYNYFCTSCDLDFTTSERLDRVPCANGHLAQRVWSFKLATSVDQEHFNVSAGRWVSNRRELRDHALRASEETTLRTGIEHNFQIMDHADKAALGVTQDGIEQIARHHGNDYVKALER